MFVAASIIAVEWAFRQRQGGEARPPVRAGGARRIVESMPGLGWSTDAGRHTSRYVDRATLDYTGWTRGPRPWLCRDRRPASRRSGCGCRALEQVPENGRALQIRAPTSPLRWHMALVFGRWRDPLGGDSAGRITGSVWFVRSISTIERSRGGTAGKRTELQGNRRQYSGNGLFRRRQSGNHLC